MLTRRRSEGGHDRFEAAFDGLAGEPALLLAVSGGPDSMALLHLAAEWRRRHIGGPELHVATVDHGLRRSSAGEAAAVRQAAEALGLAHVCLPWIGLKPTTRLQERARQVRYALLVAHAVELGATHVLTAHHADDQAETVLMRLGRGSGIAGLAGMRRHTVLAPGIVLTRPLLDRRKEDLIAVCLSRGVAFVEDPSNDDPIYARARLRAAAGAAEALGLGVDALMRLARRAALADDALEAATERTERCLDVVVEDGELRVSLASRAGGDPHLCDEILVRLLKRWIAATAPGCEGPRLHSLERIALALSAARRDGAAFRGTLGGCRLLLDAAGLLVLRREIERRTSSKAIPVLGPCAAEVRQGD